ncbi:MAG: hypothetical protein ACJ8LG_00995 [Massilia sp.]
MTFAALEADNAQQRQHGIAIGIAVSLALHALLLSAWRGNLPRPGDELAPSRPLAVWLRPLPEPLPPAQARAVTPPEAPRVRPPKSPRRVLAVPKALAPPQEAFVVRPPPRAEPAAPRADGEQRTPRFDPEAARQLARRIASEPDPAKIGTAVGQFPDKPLETETKAARAIAAAKRGNCKDGIPGGLLAPLILLLDKKDSGCKW